jgi:hypothetical protein
MITMLAEKMATDAFTMIVREFAVVMHNMILGIIAIPQVVKIISPFMDVLTLCQMVILPTDLVATRTAQVIVNLHLTLDMILEKMLLGNVWVFAMILPLAAKMEADVFTLILAETAELDALATFVIADVIIMTH